MGLDMASLNLPVLIAGAALIIASIAAAAYSAVSFSEARKEDNRLDLTASAATGEERKSTEDRFPQTTTRLEHLGIPLTGSAWYAAQAMAALLLAIVLGTAAGPAFALIGLAAPVLAARLALSAAASGLDRKFEEQIAEMEMQIAENYRSGMSVERSLRTIAKHADQPLLRHLERVNRDITYGNRTVAEALGALAERTGNGDITMLASICKIQAETGSNLAEALEFMADTIKKRLEMRRMLRIEIAEVNLTKWIAAAAPPLMLILVCSMMEEAREFYFANPLGWAAIALFALLTAVGLLTLNRMTKIDME